MSEKENKIFNLWPRWMSKKIAAQYSCYSEKQIDRLINDGLLAVVKIKMSDQKKGCQDRIDKNDIDRLMEQNKIDIEKVKTQILRKVG